MGNGVEIIINTIEPWDRESASLKKFLKVFWHI